MEILVVSGLSGAGKSNAATYLEDLGYYTVDNMPAEIIPKFADFSATSDGRYSRVALVSDIRGGSESCASLLQVIDRLRAGGVNCRLLFLRADVTTIIKRYKETRRRHPLLTEGGSVEDAVEREMELLAPLAERADFLIDTTDMPNSKLRSEIFSLFGSKDAAEGNLSVSVMSFGYKYGIPLEADLVFDVRFMPNPFYIPELRHKTGMDDEVYNYVFGFEVANAFLDKLQKMLAFLLPLYKEEGKTMLVVAIGCTGGHHRSVSITRALTKYLRTLGYDAFENHRDITRG
ncbi:MAG: RNase adapter RapZ [Oscillospiraceae bacterium]|nr:RNase adapter RapZ [Oscillospiraceae bacterium]